MSDEFPSRRDILQQIGVAIGVAAGVPVHLRAQIRTEGATQAVESLISLSPSEAATLGAMVARIIPADENGPGALEARADRFIDRALAGALQSQRSVYAEGLAALEAYARSTKGASFASLSAVDQDAVLTDVQANRATGFAGRPEEFFALVQTHTIEGTFSDPFYGGNDHFVGWDLIGYPGARVAVSADLQRMDVKPESSRKSAYDYGMFAKGAR